MIEGQGAAPTAPIAGEVAPEGQATPEQKKVAPEAAPDPYEFEDIEVKGQKQKIKFTDKKQIAAVLQKALYSEQVIKDATQAKRGAEAFMQKLKTPQGLKEVLSDPAIGGDYKRFALDIVREMMEDESLSPEQREMRQYKSENERLKEEKKVREDSENEKTNEVQRQQKLQALRGQIVTAMQKYPDIPQNQATMDALIQNMRAANRKFGLQITAEQAMAITAGQYWKSMSSALEKMSAEQILSRFGEKTLNKIQQLKLKELQNKTEPSKKVSGLDPEFKKKKSFTEKDFDKHFSKIALGGL